MSKNDNIMHSRFSDASWFKGVNDFAIPIVIGGAGGIGSWLTMLLTRVLSDTGYLFLYDFDNVEEVNMAGQLYSVDHIGKPKVEAVKEIVQKYSGFNKLEIMNEKYDVNSLKSPVMFSAFDNMEARKVMFENWKSESSYEHSIFIDGRLLAEQFQIFFVTPDRTEAYEKYLFNDLEVEDDNCSYKQTSHFAANIAAKMVQGFTNWFIKDICELPFYYEEIGSLFLATIKDD